MGCRNQPNLGSKRRVKKRIGLHNKNFAFSCYGEKIEVRATFCSKVMQKGTF
jgi:hypothetical protein